MDDKTFTSYPENKLNKAPRLPAATWKRWKHQCINDNPIISQKLFWSDARTFVPLIRYYLFLHCSSVSTLAEINGQSTSVTSESTETLHVFTFLDFVTEQEDLISSEHGATRLIHPRDLQVGGVRWFCRRNTDAKLTLLSWALTAHKNTVNCYRL